MGIKTSILQKDGHKTVYLNRTKAIRERCLNCSCWDTSEVKICTFTDCNLYPYRVQENEGDSKKRNDDIRKYCVSWCCNNQPLEVKHCPVTDCPLFNFRPFRSGRSAQKDENAVSGV
jgi:hypothetical protein